MKPWHLTVAQLVLIRWLLGPTVLLCVIGGALVWCLVQAEFRNKLWYVITSKEPL